MIVKRRRDDKEVEMVNKSRNDRHNRQNNDRLILYQVDSEQISTENQVPFSTVKKGQRS